MDYITIVYIMYENIRIHSLDHNYEKIGEARKLLYKFIRYDLINAPKKFTKPVHIKFPTNNSKETRILNIDKSLMNKTIICA